MRLLSALALTVAAVLAMLFWSCETTSVSVPVPLFDASENPHSPGPNDAFMPPGDVFLPSDTSYFPDAGSFDAGNGLRDAF
jgi:hypothetical protein